MIEAPRRLRGSRRIIMRFRVRALIVTHSCQGRRRITTRGVPAAAFDVVGAATSKPALRNMPAVPV